MRDPRTSEPGTRPAYPMVLFWAAFAFAVLTLWKATDSWTAWAVVATNLMTQAVYMGARARR